jgi:hypothetical protein
MDDTPYRERILKGGRSAVEGPVLPTIFSLTGLSHAWAEWSFTASRNIFYTDDVALFSTTR